MKKILIIIFVFYSVKSLSGDQWAEPVKIENYSLKSNFQIIMYPTVCEVDNWFLSLFKKEPKYDFNKFNKKLCHIEIFKKIKDKYQKTSYFNLINRVSPVDVLISDDGKRIVTFDTHGMAGTSSNVIVIYNRKGDLIKRFSLTDLFKSDIINKMYSTVSSIWWQENQYFNNNKTVTIKIVLEETINSKQANEWRINGYEIKQHLTYPVNIHKKPNFPSVETNYKKIDDLIINVEQGELK